MKKYGYKHNGSVPELILKRQKTQLNNSKIVRTEYYLYKRDIIKITRRVIKKLFENWNGYDYYDKEYIRDNFNYPANSNLYPSVDHKISTYYGFINKIKPEIIANIDNLCITKKRINSKKREKIYEEKLINKMKLKIINDILK